MNTVKDYFRFVAVEDSSILLSTQNFEAGPASIEDDNILLSSTNNDILDLQYSKDGKSWTQYDFTVIPLSAGETLYMKGNNSNGFTTIDVETFTGRAYTFGDLSGEGNGSTGKYECHGNIMSLMYGDDFEDKTTIPNTGCFMSLFVMCSGLLTAPELPATTLAYGCYSGMFYGCTRLNQITMLATDRSAHYCLNNWVYGVASTGIFTKHKDMNSLSPGLSGIPEGWDVVDYVA